MRLPALPSFPLADVRSGLSSTEWDDCIDAFQALVEIILTLQVTAFREHAGEKTDLPLFLSSFYGQLTASRSRDEQLHSSKVLSLRRRTFQLTGRIFQDLEHVPALLSNIEFLANFCHVHLKNPALSQTVGSIWQRQSATLRPMLQKQIKTTMISLESGNSRDGISWLAKIAPIMYASPEVGAFVLTGSDVLDALVSSYGAHHADADHKAIANFLFHGLVALIRGETPHASLLADHLYTLKMQADASTLGTSLLHDLITNTPLLATIREQESHRKSDRLNKLVDTLGAYHKSSIARRRPHAVRLPRKDKQRATDNDFHVHRMSLVTQIQDLFPDLGSGFILKLLDEYNDNVEQVTAHLLDESLPPHLAGLDRTEQVPPNGSHHPTHLTPRPTPPLPSTNPVQNEEDYISSRRNVYDDDDLSRLTINTKRLHIGKAAIDLDTAEDNTPNKAAILSALAAFDSDDDERDDTYDIDDVGGSLDVAHPDGEPGIVAKVTGEENELALFTAYKSNPELFGRTFDIRRGQARAAMKKETGMTDEAIEGWAIMLARDPKRMRKLEMQMNAFDGRQQSIERTAYREGEDDDSNTDEGAGTAGRGGIRGGRGRGRGARGRGGGRGGGNVAGPSSEPSTANAQRKKEANKGSRANHNRRNQRAKKMARGGFPG